MTKNIGIITGGNVVIGGDVTVSGDNQTPEDVNIGVITSGDGHVVVNGSFNVGGKNSPAGDETSR